ncbi:MAG TPA: dihydrolipoamide acetyltransferase family protein [Jiangellaceae bacterium]|nr:dihydrolipoamide acetyltransferase family protein [Jiangellaceae bacterium]
MSDVSQFKLPDVGEGLTEAEIVSWKVKVGDAVKVNDVIVEIETAKSLVELPSPYAGVVDGLLVEEGQTVPVGTPIIAVRSAVPGPDALQTPDEQPSTDSPAHQPTEPGEPAGAGVVGGPGEDMVPQPSPADSDSGERQAVLVGYGPRTTTARRRPRKHAASQPAAASAGASAALAASFNQPVEEEAADAARTATRVLAKPPVRKLAKDLGVDLTTLVPSGPDGTITRADVEGMAGAATRAPAGPGTGWDRLPREERVPIRSVRKATAAAVVRSAFTAPHVTEFVTVDATRTMRLVDRLRESREFSDVRLSPLAVLARAMCIAARRTPEVNARWDDDAGEIVVQRYVNLGIAAATPRGLVVPNIKDADRLPLRDLAVAINSLAATAREGKTPPADMTGGTISITNVGVFGVDTGTPILPPGEAAIMAFGAIRKQPWVHRDKVRPRWVTTLALSFDHRLVDGEPGSRFLADVAAILHDPAQALVWS